jgi:dihydroxyacetone kinase-like protein
VDGVQARGKAEPNDKTMLDTLWPARAAFAEAIAEGASFSEALQRSAAAGEEGMKATIPLVARKGRASYLGERSAGHQDPGSTSSFLLLKTFADTWAGAYQRSSPNEHESSDRPIGQGGKRWRTMWEPSTRARPARAS